MDHARDTGETLSYRPHRRCKKAIELILKRFGSPSLYVAEAGCVTVDRSCISFGAHCVSDCDTATGSGMTRITMNSGPDGPKAEYCQEDRQGIFKSACSSRDYFVSTCMY